MSARNLRLAWCLAGGLVVLLVAMPPGIPGEGDALHYGDASADPLRPCHLVVIEMVPVGNPGNPPDTTGYGAVDYGFEMGTYEITAGQYASFLNSVARTDTYRLYNENMWFHEHGCRIERLGDPGSYTYRVAAEWADRPVNFVSWGDAARFANWLHNNQPHGAQNLETTEDGSYFLNGRTSDRDLEDIIREKDATWVIPSEDEWYKAAYHLNNGPTGNYFNFPTATDAPPSNDLIDPDPGNNATFHDLNKDTIGPPYYRTEIGAHENSESPYGTFDQGGNVMEWNQAVPERDIRGVRGGSYEWGRVLLRASARETVYHSSDQFGDVGFRVARVK